MAGTPKWINLLVSAAAITAPSFATTGGLGTPINVDGSSGIGYYLDKSGSPQALGGGALLGFATRTALAAAPTTLHYAFLTESGREGAFFWSATNLQVQVTADTQQGLFVPPTGQNGSTGAWVRRYAGPADFRWFGGLADMTANGVGTNNTPAFDAARAALIAAGRNWLHISQQSAAYRFAAAPAAIHDGLLLTGEGWYQNPGTVGANTYVGIQLYPGTVLGFASDTAGFKIVAFTDNASNAKAFEYQGGTNTTLRELMLYSEGGTGTTAHGIESFDKFNLENVRVLGFAGCGVKIEGDDSGTANQYGNAILSSLINVYSTQNKLHGFHITGNNGNVINFTNCFSQLNGGAAFLDFGPFGNNYTNCLAATNNQSFGTPAGFSAAQRAQCVADYAPLATQLNGSFVGYSGVQANTYNACYVETGAGSYPDIGFQSVVNGGQLANYTWQFNVGTNFNPTINSGRGVDTPQLNFTTHQSTSAITVGNAKIYRGANRGLVLQGAPNGGGAQDITFVNLNDVEVAYILSGSTIFTVPDKVNTVNGYQVNGVLRLDGNHPLHGKAATSSATYVAPAGGTTIDTQARASLAQLAADLTDMKAKLQAVTLMT